MVNMLIMGGLRKFTNSEYVYFGFIKKIQVLDYLTYSIQGIGEEIIMK